MPPDVQPRGSCRLRREPARTRKHPQPQGQAGLGIHPSLRPPCPCPAPVGFRGPPAISTKAERRRRVVRAEAGKECLSFEPLFRAAWAVVILPHWSRRAPAFLAWDIRFLEDY